MDLDSLRTYVQVAELASFTRAAERLGLTRARVSAVVQQLEATLGTRLLQRTTRTVRITPDGEAFLERAQALLAEADDLQSLFSRQPAALRGRIRADVPLQLGARLVLPRLPEFLAAHPLLEVDLGSTDRRVDLVHDGFDCVLRVGVLQESGLVARPVGQMAQANLASPAYLGSHGHPRNLDDLRSGRHRLVRYSSRLAGWPALWEYVENGEPRSVVMPAAVTVNNTLAYEAACRAGLGMIQAPVLGHREALARGELVEVLPQWRPAPLPITLLYAHRRQVPRRLQVFMDWLAGVVGEALSADQRPPEDR
ncbi:LysR family transcriptional regulator [Pseudacidovorax intermedius]|uniref:Transcriptional regulator n=1 Tax=Pseudacidovorax intermedius TaxID=433924 RepID=A0A147GW64_9BURK|nr:LysR family transcriptional regulator [Pseudacidovorax intermedius]KTT21757.1 transcriptional regulator [Pseudacidovorax intermedius]